MSDSFTVTTRKSWFSRIAGSIGGVFIGFLLILAMIAGLFWNEGRAVTTARSLAEGASLVVDALAETVDRTLEGNLIHLAGTVTATSRPADDAFGISTEAVRLTRNAEMYQWSETARSESHKQLGGGEETVTTYSYAKRWNDEPIDSSSFQRPGGHRNPPMEVRGKTFQIPSAKLGAFDLGAPVLGRIRNTEPLPLAAKDLPAIQAAYGGTSPVSVVDGRLYIGANAGSPRIGDIRISYERVPLGPISVVGRQSGTTLSPYATNAGDALLLVRSGILPAEAMFKAAVSDNLVLTWALRLGGLVLLWIGFGLVLGPLAVIADVIPFVGSLVRLGTGILSLILAIVVGAAVIAIAWFAYRPLLAMGIVAAALAVVVLLAWLARARGPRPAPAQPNWGRAKA